MLGRRVVAGFFSGASVILGLLSLLVLAFFAAGIWTLFQDLAGPFGGQLTFWQRLAGSLGASFGAIPPYFWSARLGIAAIGVLGVVLALADAIGPRIQRPWQPWVGIAVTLGIVGAVIVGFMYSSRENVTATLVDDPVVWGERTALLAGDSTLLSTSVLLTLGASYVIWVGWNFWYRRWSGWLRIKPIDIEPPPAPAPAEDPAPRRSEWIEYQERMARLRSQTSNPDELVPAVTPYERPKPWLQWMLVALAATTVLAFLVLRLYYAVGPDVVSGELWVTSETPAVATHVELDREPRRMTFSNTAGVGTIEALVQSTTENPTARRLDPMELAGSAERYVTSSLDLQGLAAGTYRVEIRLQDGPGGLMRFATLVGSATAGSVMAWLFGLFVGLWLALATLACLEFLAERGTFNPST